MNIDKLVLDLEVTGNYLPFLVSAIEQIKKLPLDSECPRRPNHRKVTVKGQGTDVYFGVFDTYRDKSDSDRDMFGVRRDYILKGLLKNPKIVQIGERK